MVTRQRENRKIDNKIIKKLNNLFEENKDILTVYIYGSYGTDYEHKNSDIDIAVLFSKKRSLMKELYLAAEIENILKKETDLISLNKTNVLLKYKILKTGTLIYEKDPLKTADFKESVLKEYFDFGIKLKKIKKDFHQGLREEYSNES